MNAASCVVTVRVAPWVRPFLVAVYVAQSIGLLGPRAVNRAVRWATDSGVTVVCQ